MVGKGPLWKNSKASKHGLICWAYFEPYGNGRTVECLKNVWSIWTVHLIFFPVHFFLLSRNFFDEAILFLLDLIA